MVLYTISKVNEISLLMPYFALFQLIEHCDTVSISLSSMRQVIQYLTFSQFDEPGDTVPYYLTIQWAW